MNEVASVRQARLIGLRFAGGELNGGQISASKWPCERL